MIMEAELLQDLAALPIEKRAITNLHVLNEAYDYAKPMLAAASGGLSETVLDGQTGFLHEPGGAGGLARDVQAMEMMSAEERRTMGALGRQWRPDISGHQEAWVGEP